MTTALEHDILAELRERDLEVVQLRAQLRRRGHAASRETVYERLVHLESTGRLGVKAKTRGARTWWAR